MPSTLRILPPALAALVLLASVSVRAAPEAAAPDSATEQAPSAGAPAKPETEPAEPEEAPPPLRTGRDAARQKEEIRRDVMDEVRRELAKAREELRDEITYVENEADARAYDAEQLRELQQSVNLLQLHGYFRLRGDLFQKADLGRGADPAGNTLFPRASGSDTLGNGNLRLRLNPVLRISSGIAIYSQLDVLDNLLLGSSPVSDQAFDPFTPVNALASRTAATALSVKRVWAEVETPFGQLAFGRKGAHFGEGMVYNDGNCIDCDYGSTFDRLQFTFGPVLRGHVFTLAADALSSGPGTGLLPPGSAFAGLSPPQNLQQLNDALRFSLQISHTTLPQEIRRKLDNAEWVLDYSLLGAYRAQTSETAVAVQQGTANPADATLRPLGASFGEVGAWAQFQFRKLRLATEGATLFGSVSSRVEGGQGFAQSLDFLQFAGVLRASYAFLKQDSLLVGLDVGAASGDRAPGMGARPFRSGAAGSPNTSQGDIDGRQFNCTATTCTDRDVNNFTMNPDFRIDQLLWRNLFTRITDAFFVRPELRWKPGGRPSGGGDEDGFEISGAVVYSQALLAESTPGGSAPLGVEADAAVTYTSRDRFLAAVIYGVLVPLGGLDPFPATGGSGASVGQVVRGMVGVTF